MVTVVREEDSCGAMAVKNGDGEVEGWMPPGERFGHKNSSVASHCCQLSDNMHDYT